MTDAFGNLLSFVEAATASPISIETVWPTLIVTDGCGAVVHEAVTSRAPTPSFGPWFVLPIDASPCVCTAALRWDAGPYLGVVEATTTFVVVSD